ncbi:MAG TPA: hypothetical protein VF384_18915 [Planctomycetota bacterium]
MFLTAQGQDPPKPAGQKPPAATPAKPAPVFVIAKSGDKLEVITKEALEAKNKALDEEYTKAKGQYDKDKKAAEAAQKKFDGAEPKKAVITTVGAEYPSKEAAEAAVKKMDEDKAKSGEKAKEPKKDEPKKK